MAYIITPEEDGHQPVVVDEDGNMITGIDDYATRVVGFREDTSSVDPTVEWENAKHNLEDVKGWLMIATVVFGLPIESITKEDFDESAVS